MVSKPYNNERVLKLQAQTYIEE
jgi:hypothetical protein